MRNVYCGVLTAADAGKTVELAGWVYRRRDHGGLIFFDLRDVTGIVQVVFSPEIAPSVHEQAHEIKPEYVVTIKGTVSPRPEGTENPNIATGQIEVLVSSFSVLNTCKPLPFQLDEPAGDEEAPNESLRLKYRYLDMRRPQVQERFLARSKASQAIRTYLTAQGFYEIETPFLSKSTPEGARDFIVPSQAEHRAVLRPSPVAAALQTDIDGGRVRQVLPDRPLLPGRGPEGGPAARIHPARPGDELRRRGRCNSAERRPHEGPLRIDHGDALSSSIAENGLHRGHGALRVGQARSSVRASHGRPDAALFVHRVRCLQKDGRGGGAIKGLALRGKTAFQERPRYCRRYGQVPRRRRPHLDAQREGKLVSPIVKYLTETETPAIDTAFGLENGDVVFIMADERAKVNDIMGQVPPLSGRTVRPYQERRVPLPVGRRFPALRIQRGREEVRGAPPPFHVA